MLFINTFVHLAIFIFLSNTPLASLTTTERLTNLETNYNTLKLLVDNSQKTLNELLLALTSPAASGATPIIRVYSNPGNNIGTTGLQTTPYGTSNAGSLYSTEQNPAPDWGQVVDDLRRINYHYIFDPKKDQGVLAGITTSNYDSIEKAIKTLANSSVPRDTELKYYAVLKIMAGINGKTNYDLGPLLYEETTRLVNSKNLAELVNVKYDNLSNARSNVTEIGGASCFTSTQPNDNNAQRATTADGQEVWFTDEGEIYALRKYIDRGSVPQSWPETYVTGSSSQNKAASTTASTTAPSTTGSRSQAGTSVGPNPRTNQTATSTTSSRTSTRTPSVASSKTSSKVSSKTSSTKKLKGM